jgi:hypothetical protein
MGRVYVTFEPFAMSFMIAHRHGGKSAASQQQVLADKLTRGLREE